MNSFSLAWREVRLHPSRFVAMLAALVLSVGFLAAIQVYTATEADAASARAALWASRADVVVETHLWHWPDARYDRDTSLADAESLLDQDPDVAYHERFSRLAARLSNGSTLTGVMLNSVVTHPGLQWYPVSQGRAPRTTREIMLTTDTARQLGVGIGDVVHLDVVRGGAMTVVGLTDQRGDATPPAYVTYGLLLEADKQFPTPNYNIVADPSAKLDQTPYSSGDGIGIVLLVKARDPGTAGSLAERMREVFLRKIVLHADPKSAAEVRQEAAASGLGGTGWLGSLTTATAAMSLVVGAITVATTFGILIAQRRRQIGLLRAVGASKGQIARWFLVEATLLGVVGALVGTPAGIGAAALICWLGTHSIGYGLVVPWARLAVIAVAGVFAAVVAALVPAREATRVSPLEALNQAATRGPSRAGLLRHRVATAGAVALGALAMVAALVAGPRTPTGVRIALVVAGALAVAVALLAAAPLYLPPVMRALARGARRHPVVELAASNAARNPVRSGATSASLMLAVGLIVTVIVGTAVGSAGAMAHLRERYPVDVSLQAAIQEPEPVDMAFGRSPISNRDANGMLVGFSSDALGLVRSTPGVADAGEFLTSEPLTIIAGPGLNGVFPVMALVPAAEPLLSRPVTLTDGQVGLPTEVMHALKVSPGSTVTLQPLVGNEVDLHVVESNIGPALAVVTPATLARIGVHTKPGLILTRLDGSRPAATVLDHLSARLIPENSGLDVSGSVQQQENLRRVIDGARRILIGLLSVVAVVAMVGVANTLGLSVIERTRESALLRALGLGRRSLRLMLLVEAVALSVVALVLGGLAGVWFGWAGAAVVLHEVGALSSPLVVPWIPIALAGLAVVVAGAAASVLPGRAAARATPIEALADLG